MPSLVRNYDKVNFRPPAAVIDIIVSIPGGGQAIPFLAEIDSGADLSVIPEIFINQHHPALVDSLEVGGYGTDPNNEPPERPVYSVVISIKDIGMYTISVVGWKEEYVLLGRDVINSWEVLLDGKQDVLRITP